MTRMILPTATMSSRSGHHSAIAPSLRGFRPGSGIMPSANAVATAFIALFIASVPSHSSWPCTRDSATCSTPLGASFTTGSPTAARYNIFSHYARHGDVEYSTPGLFADAYGPRDDQDDRDVFRLRLTTIIQFPAALASEVLINRDSGSSKILGFVLTAPNSSVKFRSRT